MNHWAINQKVHLKEKSQDPSVLLVTVTSASFIFYSNELHKEKF